MGALGSGSDDLARPTLHVARRGGDNRSGSNPLQAVDDDAFTGAQAVRNDPQPVVDAAQLNGSKDDFVFVVVDV